MNPINGSGDPKWTILKGILSLFGSINDKRERKEKNYLKRTIHYKYLSFIFFSLSPLPVPSFWAVWSSFTQPDTKSALWKHSPHPHFFIETYFFHIWKTMFSAWDIWELGTWCLGCPLLFSASQKQHLFSLDLSHGVYITGKKILMNIHLTKFLYSNTIHLLFLKKKLNDI